MHTEGKLDEALPILANIGFDAVHPVVGQVNDIFALKKQWAGKMAFVGGFPADLLTHGSRDEIEQTVKEYCRKLAPGGGYVFGSSTETTDKVPPKNFVAMTNAVHKYGVYPKQA